MDIESPTDHNMQQRLKASLLGVVGSFVLFAAYLAIPPLGIFSGVLAPFPAAYNRILHGRLSALIILFGTTTAITILFGIFAGALYLSISFMIGLLLPELLLRGVSGSHSVFWTTLLNVLFFYFSFIIYGYITGVNLQESIFTEISNSMNQAIILYEKAGVTAEDMELLKSSMNVVAGLLKRTYPVLITAMFLLISICNIALIKKTTANMVHKLNIAEFSSFKNPDIVVWILIASGIIQLLPVSLLTEPSLNILLVLMLLYFIQGMAVVSALITRFSISAFFRTLLYIVMIIQPYFLMLIAVIGLFDLWVDFRTPKTQENL